jgi:hypothetical protein
MSPNNFRPYHIVLCLWATISLRLKYLMINTINNIRDQLLIYNRHILNNYDNRVGIENESILYISLQLIAFRSIYKHQHFFVFFLTTNSETLLGNQHKSETGEKLNMTSTSSNRSRSCSSSTCRDMSLTFCLQTTCMHTCIYIHDRNTAV